MTIFCVRSQDICGSQDGRCVRGGSVMTVIANRSE